MSFRVSGKNLDIGAALQDHARARVSALIGKYFDAQPNGHVTIEPEGSGFRTDMFIHLANGLTLQAEGRAHDPYASFDQAGEHIEKRLRRHKRRLKDRHSGAQPASGESTPAGDTVANYVIEAPGGDEIAPDFQAVVVAETKAPLKSLSVSAAVLELDMSGAQLLFFRHSSSAEVNAVYRREDGHIGWIDPSGTPAGTLDGS
jgi:ribosomal subunit interface protein